MSRMRCSLSDIVQRQAAGSARLAPRVPSERCESLPEALEVLQLSLRSPLDAKARYPNYRLTQLVSSRLDLDDTDLARLSNILRLDLLHAVPDVLEPFNDHLRLMIVRYGLETLFVDDRQTPYHHAIRPTGYDFDRDEIIPTGMEKWRADYRALPEERQMLAASIVWLYRAGKDNAWLRRVPCTWHATDGVMRMRATKVLEDWARLFALYPGW